MFVCIEHGFELCPWTDELDEVVRNVYGPFPTLEAAEEFRSKHKNKADCDCYLLQSPDEESS